MSLMDTLEIDNEAFQKALTIHFEQVSKIFRRVLSVFWYSWFDTDTSQHAIVYQNEGHFILYLVIWLVVCGVNRFRVMIDFLRDGSACPVFCKTLQFSGLNGGHVRNVSRELS